MAKGAVKPRTRVVRGDRNKLDTDGELGSVLEDIKKNYGDKVARPASRRAMFQHISTGIFTLDMALMGGIPRSHISTFIGWESSGKTTFALKTAAKAQSLYQDQAVAFFDIEGHYDPVWAEKNGVNNDNLVLVEPESGEHAVDLIGAFLKSKETSLIVVDSLAALLPLKEEERSAEDPTVGMQARLVGQLLRRATSCLLQERKRSHIPALLTINQWRNKVGQFYGDPKVMPGGHAQKFFATTRVEFYQPKTEHGQNEQDVTVVNKQTHRFKVHKNKLANSIHEGEFTMIRNPNHPLGESFIDDARTALTYGKKFGLVTGGGVNQRLEGVDRKFKTLMEMTAYLYDNPDIFENFKNKLISTHRKNTGMNADGWL